MQQNNKTKKGNISEDCWESIRASTGKGFGLEVMVCYKTTYLCCTLSTRGAVKINARATKFFRCVACAPPNQFGAPHQQPPLGENCWVDLYIFSNIDCVPFDGKIPILAFNYFSLSLRYRKS